MSTPEQWYTAIEVAKLLGVSRATFYRLSWFRSRKHYATDRAVRYAASDVALYQHLNADHPRAA